MYYMMMKRDNMLSKLTLDQLQSYFSDFHKEFYGYRPRFASPEQWRDREWLTTSIEDIHNAMDKMKETFAGREELRERGWVIDEVEPELIEQAKWLEEERQLKYLELEKQYEMMSYDEERV
jgi:hypothetical protein